MTTITADAPHVLRATLIGGTAVLMWSTLAVLTAASGPIPPFELTALAFGVAFLVSLAKWLARGEPIGVYLRQPWKVWALGIAGLFGYHALYFIALKTAPAVDANLINYLWPLLIVLFSAFLPGERLRWWHLAGAAAGLAGTVLLVTRGGGVALDPRYVGGYLAALGCAVTWSSYSVLSRRVKAVPTDTVGGFCGVTAVLAALCHVAFETTVVPQGAEWLVVLAMGLGPVGAAFFVWDYGVKHGNIRALGAASYATPLLSTLLLVVFGRAEPSWILAASCLLIVGGAALASSDMFAKR